MFPEYEEHETDGTHIALMHHPVPGGVVEIPMQEPISGISPFTFDMILDICLKSALLTAPEFPVEEEQKVMEAFVTSTLASRIGSSIGAFLGIEVIVRTRGFHVGDCRGSGAKFGRTRAEQ